MYKLVKSSNCTLTPRKAETFLKANTFPGQRPMSRDWVNNLILKHETGTFTKAHIAFAHNGDNIDVLVNGQHQCQMCVDSGKSVNATIDYYDVETKDDLWHLFATFDSHRQRTELHVMKAARGLFKSPALQAVPLGILSACGSALLWLGGGTTPAFTAKTLTKADKADLVQKYESDVLWAASFGVNYIHVAIMCAMMVTRRKNEELAQAFWERVIHGDQLVRGTPQWNLHNQIANFRGSRGGGNRNVLLYRLCILWWNAYATGEKRTQANFRSMKGIPEAKGGTEKRGRKLALAK